MKHPAKLFRKTRVCIPLDQYATDRNCTKLAVIFFGMAILIFSSVIDAASVATVAVEASKNDAILKNTNIITIDDTKVRVDYLGTEAKRTKTTPFLLTIDNGKN